MLCSVPVILGNFCYSITGIFPKGAPAEGWMLFSRLITGVGAYEAPQH